jgi:signal transduction histidine kinase/ActR/RegA family two-component response regulator
LRGASLTVKLTLLGALVTSLVVLGAFWALSVETRRGVRTLFADQLSQQQRTLLRLQQDNLDQLVWGTGVVTLSPTLRSALETFRVESDFGSGANPQLVLTVERELARLLERVDRDAMLLTDLRGRVFAAAARGSLATRGWPAAGADFSRLPAVRRVIAPSAPADSGALGVIRDGDLALQVAVFPLVLDGFGVGTLMLAERLDEGLAASARAAFKGEVAITAGTTLLSGTMSDTTLGRRLASLNPDAGESPLIDVNGVGHVVAGLALGETQLGERVTLWLMQPLDRTVKGFTAPLLRDFLIYGLLAVALTALGAAVAARSVLRPLDAFVGYLRSGAAVNRTAPRFPASGQPAEIQTLNESFEQLMDSVDRKQRELTQRTTELTASNAVLVDEIRERERMEQALGERDAQLRQSQKLEAVGTLAGGIAHDFNNLLTAMSGFAQLAIMNAGPDSPLTGDLRQVVEAADRASHLTRQLLAFSRKQVLQPAVLDVAEVVGGMEPLLTRLLGEHIRVRMELDAEAPRVLVDRGQLEQVIMNLAINARDAMPVGGSLTLSVASDPRSERDDVVLSVQDTGTGIPEELRSRIFEPFFTTKEPGKGTGLGLSTVYGIVTQSGGRIEVESVVGAGTTFRVVFPPAREALIHPTPHDEPAELPRGTETILLVEDEPSVRMLGRRTLEGCGYTVLPASDGAEALRLAASARIDLLLTDITMPGMSGPELVAEFLMLYPAPVVVYMSGYADDASIAETRSTRAAFLKKPFTTNALARCVRDALDASQRISGIALDV